MTAPITELFSSIQGEGLLVGERQVFLRFAGCNLCCAYCDTPGAQQAPPAARIERPSSLPLRSRGGAVRHCCHSERVGQELVSCHSTSPSPPDFDHLPNPLTTSQLTDAIRRLTRPQPGLHHSVALTGGEPLLHAAFLAELLPLLGDLGLQAYLETNGTLADELVTIIPHLDTICADIKLPSSTREAPQWEAHERFALALAAHEDPSRLDFWKCVVTANATDDEIDLAAQLLAAINPESALILQPVTPHHATITAPAPHHMLHLQAIAKRHLPTVRIIPQTHLLGGYL
jgi:organic radical activating enzyme